MKIVIVGAGPAGLFAALTAREFSAEAEIVIYERTTQALANLAKSGNGKGNPTVVETDPELLVEAFPRGGRELLGPLYEWGPRETVDWFARQGMPLEPDARGGWQPMGSDGPGLCRRLLELAAQARIQIILNRSVTEIRRQFDGGYRLWFREGEPANGDRLLLATGGGGKGFGMAEELGHTVEKGLPAMLQFHCQDERLRHLQSAVAGASVLLPKWQLSADGPVDILPRGLGGRAIDRVSCLAARELAAAEYQFTVHINWVRHLGGGQPTALLQQEKLLHGRRPVAEEALFELPPPLWQRLIEASGIAPGDRWGSLTIRTLQVLAGQLANCRFLVEGYGLSRNERTVCGGVALPEVDFRTMRSRVSPNLWLAGEILHCDGLPGGYNLQAAWTTARLAGRSIATT